MEKVELLSPAGNFDALKGAVSAGADAVYLGGERYGARAYADNFTTEEICEGIHFAHFFGRKIYLTVNTLVKERELDELYSYMLPFYEKGLDGVIVQDFGVLRFLRTYFPGLALHASTQMALTGPKGVRLVREEKVSRVVPARELSLGELISLKEETGVEIEAFVHGAMCYSYSGQCLLSSILGGRSGNRGRCAQPCRLPYQAAAGISPKAAAAQKDCYPLSMKDLCTISLLPALIEAGIDSFKIEGRMKDPAYAAGVTAIYRKYIDLYYQDKKHFRIEEEDQKLLTSLYIRTGTGEGYYQRINGREMISLSSPAYSPTKEALLTEIRQKYIDTALSSPARAKICLRGNEPARLYVEAEGVSVSCEGDIVQKAQKQPLTGDKISAQLKKCGNSLIRIDQVAIEEAENVFLPVAALNELRRNALSALEKEIRKAKTSGSAGHAASFQPSALSARSKETVAPDFRRSGTGIKKLHVSVLTIEQLKAALSLQVERIYVDYALLDGLGNIPYEGAKLYGAVPYIIRKKEHTLLQKLQNLILSGALEGVLVRNLESAAYFAENISREKIVLDGGLYLWNRESVHFWEPRAGEFYLPLECNRREWRELLDACPDRKIMASACIYGRLPMMVSANCVKKTLGKCSPKREFTRITDRYGKQFPVYSDCPCCYNIIYNSVPLSLHRQLEREIFSDGNYRLDFTLEPAEETGQIIRYFNRLVREGGKAVNGEIPACIHREYTTGHYKRGVE